MATIKRFIAKNGLDNNSNTIINVSDPVNAQDAATKAFSSNAANLTSGVLPSARLPAFTGDATSTAGSTALTLATTGVTAGSYSNLSLTVDAKGRITAINSNSSIDGIAIGSTTPSTGAFTTLSASSTVTLSGGTANGVAYLNASKQVTSGTALTFDGTNTLSLNTGGSAIFNVGNTGSYGVVTAGGTNPAAIYFNGATRTSFGSFLQYGATNHVFYNETLGSEWMRLTSTGLGIGTSSPSSKLTVSSTGSSIELKQASVGSATYYVMDNTIETGGKRWRFGYTGGAGIPTFSLLNATDNVTSWVADSSGNLGLGVTPSAWISSYKALELGSGSLVYPASTTNLQIAMNGYANSSGVYTYKANGIASLYSLGGGGASHVWYTAPSGTAGNAISFSQAMTLDASGNLLVGTTSSNANVTVSDNTSGFAYYIAAGIGSTVGLASTAKNDYSMQLNRQGNTDGGIATFRRNGTQVGYITVTGSATAYNTSSDQRLKTDLGVSTSTDVIDNIVIHDFEWKTDGSKSRGVFAQEAYVVKPEAVSVGTDELNEDGLPVHPWGVDYSKYVPDLIVYCQQLKAEIESLTARITT